MVRVLSIWLPQLPLDRWVRRRDVRLTGPFAVTAETRNAWRITHANPLALKHGVRTGQPLADARAICPDLITEPSDAVREALLLRALWRWADCLSPRVALDSSDGLLLDVTGCAHLFGGERAMGEYAQTALVDLSLTSRLGFADTKHAARGLARFGQEDISIAVPGNTAAVIRDLPVAALRLSEQIITDLARTGLTTIGQLYAIKSSELARRYGLELTKALGMATGQAPDPLSPKAAKPIYAARMTLPEPIGLLEDIEAVLERLAKPVCHRLMKDQLGARQFHLIVRSPDGGTHDISIGFATPCADEEPILRQFTHPLGKLKLPFGADWFRLAASNTETIRARQLSIGDEAKKTDQRTRLIETLGNRLGFDRVRVFAAGDCHLPENESSQIDAVKQLAPHWIDAPRERPIRLYTPPEWIKVKTPGRPPHEFTWRRVLYHTDAAAGPERLTPRWYADKDLRTRDYWKVQTKEGQRLWLLTYPAAPVPEWYVAGVFP